MLFCIGLGDSSAKERWKREANHMRLSTLLSPCGILLVNGECRLLFFFPIFLSLTNPNGQIDMRHHAHVSSLLDPSVGLSAGRIEGNQTIGIVLATACQKTNYPSLI